MPPGTGSLTARQDARTVTRGFLKRLLTRSFAVRAWKEAWPQADIEDDPATIKACLHASAIAATENGELVTGDDAEFLLWLLDRHPRAAEKIGCGVAGFTVQDAQMGTRCFVVHRVDGSSTDFSFYSCITAPDGTVLVRRAMRRAISDQTSEFKRASAARGPLVCAVTGQVLSWDNAHVDHAPPVFVALADDWAARVGGYSAIRLTPAADSQLGRTIADGAAAEAWAEFHRTNAQLRIVSRLANLSLLRKRS